MISCVLKQLLRSTIDEQIASFSVRTGSISKLLLPIHTAMLYYCGRLSIEVEYRHPINLHNKMGILSAEKTHEERRWGTLRVSLSSTILFPGFAGDAGRRKQGTQTDGFLPT